MAERRKRGLGRGLGALIPDAASNDHRPVDVFFSGGDPEEGKQTAEDSKAPRAARTDPAASMQSSRRRKPKAGATETGAAAKSSKPNSSSSDGSAKKTAESKKTASTTPKSGAASAKSVPAKSTGTKSTASSKARKAAPKSTKAESGSKTTATTNKTASSKTASAKDKASSAAAKPVAKTEEAVKASNAAADFVSADTETSSDGEVFESHPGVYTSSGDRVDEPRDKREPATSDTTDEVTEAAGSADRFDAPEVEDPSSEESGEGRTEIAGVDSIPDTEYGEIDVELIEANPRQPRTFFDEDQLSELVHSIREIGVLQPVVVRQKPSDSTRFELIMGERRLRATKDAGLSTIPAIIRYVDDNDLLRDALLENLHRAELNPLEEAAAYGQLLEDFGCTQEELSERIGRSRPQISNTLRLLRLPPLVQRRVAAGVISAGHARAILGLRESEHMEVLAQRIVAEGMSVRASEEAVILINRGDSMNVSRATTRVSPQFIEVAERLGDRLDTKVNITVGKKKGKLSVEFANQDDLDRILTLLGVSSESE